MRRFLQLILPLCCLISLQAAGSPAENTGRLKHLDRIINDRSRYHLAKEKEIDSLKHRLRQAVSDEERFALCSRLYEMYIAYQTDSALKYIREKEKLLPLLADSRFRYDTQMNLIGVMTVTGMYKEALDVLAHLPHQGVPDSLRQGYFHHCRTLYGHMADYALTNEEKN